MINYSKEDVQAGILQGIKKDNCYLVSTWCPPANKSKQEEMKSFLSAYAEHITTAADVEGNPAVIRTMALGRVAFNRLEIANPFGGPQREFVENFLYANSLADRPRFKVGNEYCVLLQLWCDDGDREAVEDEIESIRSELISAGLYSERFFKTVHVRRKTRVITDPDEKDRIKSIGPLGFVEGAGNPKEEAEVVESCLVSTEMGVGTFMAFLNCRVNKPLFETTARKLTKLIFRRGDGEGPESELDYGKAQLMGQFPDESRDFGSRGASLSPGLDPPIPLEGYCPFGAHAKLMEQVTDSQAGADSEPPLPIVRRGIAYEYTEEVKDLYAGPQPAKENHGLYFISYQKSIKDQFIPLLRKMQHNDLVMYRKAARSTEEIKRPKSKFHYRRGSPENSKLMESDLQFLTILSEGYYFVPGKAYIESLSQVV